MHFNLKSKLAAGASCLVISGAVGAANATEPFDPHGNVGKTNYTSLPFERNIYYPCWLCSVDLEPSQLFFSANPASYYLNTSLMLQARQTAAIGEAAGLIPASGAQRWEDTYEASYPAGTFKGEPSWIQADRTAGSFPKRPEFVAWRNFISSHQSYQDVAYDGGSMPTGATYFRSWGGSWGHLSPLTPLNAADCPPDMKSGCTWGDSYAYRWSLTAGKTGGYGIMLSDFSDAQPWASYLHDFSLGIIGAFAKTYGQQATLSPMTSAQAATWIEAHMYPQWNDYLSQGYANYYKALATRLGTATSRTGLVIDQCGVTPAYRRVAGSDGRFIAQTMGTVSYICIWDDQVIQRGRGGPVTSPIMSELAGFVVAAAREPLLRNGANLEADDSAYWSSIASYYPTLNAASQKEVGYKLMKRLWAWSAWAHIADRSGLVRRAISFTSRDYWDDGSLLALAPLTTLIQTIVPTTPFGPALYYSVAVERQTELNTEKTATGNGFSAYLQPNFLQQFLDAGPGFGYYVSDAALPDISATAHNAPSAWVVINAGTLLPSAELATLQKTAPVVTTPQALAALPNQPFHVSAGLTGFAFKDQSGRIIAVVSNPSPSPTAASINGTITLRGLSGTTITATNLMTKTGETLPISGGVATIPISLTRWDTIIGSIVVN